MLGNILAAFWEYKKLSLIFIVAFILMVFVMIMAVRSSRRRNRDRDDFLERARKESELRKAFAHVTAESALSADGKDLMHGLALNIQKTLDKAPDLLPEFESMPDGAKYIYALSFVFCEDAETLSAFFRLNGKPLTYFSLLAAREIFDSQSLALFEEAYKMFDDEDEETSCLPERVEEIDKAFSETDKTTIFQNVKTFVSQNIEAFRLDD